MRVLISAYACEPGKGSEPGAGWAWARAAAVHHDVWVLTRENNRTAIEDTLLADPELRLHPVYLDLPANVRRWKRGNRGVHLYYVLWQRKAARVALSLNAISPFDLIHHVTFAVDWLPAGSVSVRGVPHVWGPVGGGAATPWKLLPVLGARGAARDLLRRAVTRVGRLAFGRRIAKRSALVIAQNSATAQRFRHLASVEIRPNAVIDIPGAIADSLTTFVHGSERRAIFVGKLVPMKGLSVAIKALSLSTALDWHLDVVGEGPDLRRYQHLAKKAGVGDRVTFIGQLDREDLLRRMATASALVFPSLHDQSSYAVAEAAALGVPVVCFRIGGQPRLVRSSTAVVIEPTVRAAEAFAAALSSLGKEVRRRRSEEWGSSELVGYLDQVYRQIAGASEHSLPCVDDQKSQEDG